MERITVLSDGNRGIAYENIIEMFNQWIVEGQEISIRDKEQNEKKRPIATWEKSRYCIIDYMDASQAISASNAIRAFLPQIPLLVITDFQSLIRRQHLQQVTGNGVIKMILWNQREPHQLMLDMQEWLHSTLQNHEEAMPSAVSIQKFTRRGHGH
ncbi:MULTISPECIES: hypothetical protein [Paenibacillus]|uniref:Uncharacterized protein n=1 Tax=Paenibacillus xylanilyticus TaxID=248903 RepID=A0A7Y6BVT0_9BACL|nr:hypothetical protein [Paenibacillus xylanilyticus]NUU75513.1 hypothetical protein [Paenibacillus xylanilyticus]